MTTTTPPGTAVDPRRRPPRGRGRRLVVAGVVAALAVGGVLEVRHRDAVATERLVAALATLETAGSDLDAAVADGRALLAESEGRVADDGLRGALADTLDAADLDLAVAPGTRVGRTAQATRLSGEVARHALRVRAAAGAVRSDHRAWLLARAVEKHAADLAALGAAVEAGEALLAGTHGQVLPDDAPREVLRTALDAAVGARETVVDRGDVAAVTRAGEHLADRSARLAAAVAGVAEAHEAWRVAEAQRVAEGERVAAEQAEAEAARRRSVPQSSAGTAAGTGSSAGTGSAGGRPGPAAPGGSGGGHWVDEGDVPGPDLCVWVDQHDVSGTC